MRLTWLDKDVNIDDDEMVQTCIGSLEPRFWQNEIGHPRNRKSSLLRSLVDAIGQKESRLIKEHNL